MLSPLTLILTPCSSFPDRRALPIISPVGPSGCLPLLYQEPDPISSISNENPAEHTTLSRQCVHCPQYILPDQSVCDVQNHLKLRFSAAIAAIVIGIRRSPICKQFLALLRSFHHIRQHLHPENDHIEKKLDSDTHIFIRCRHSVLLPHLPPVTASVPKKK